ncbi:putative TOS1-like glycosyl hydrolase-domain-containing protein [Cercophora scortea]|uniref:glucan endo-1,3-beta-D-glucosidase n=1 Tax=Cercophora scortea TaxID=314031 RepID=A0AAE0J401_9PEZI|nr:putative TOS1-like glycosyl hydrolase-domain-containing protein [Cercophora scortea]
MRFQLAVTLIAAASTANAAAPRARAKAIPSEQLCVGTAHQENGNWYCQAVRGVSYQNVGKDWEYGVVTGMNEGNGELYWAPHAYSGPLAPFNEPMSFHFRGPIALKQFAVYLPNSNLGGLKKREESDHPPHESQNSHVHLPRHTGRLEESRKKQEKRGANWVHAVIDGVPQSWIHGETWASAVINGQPQSWINNYFGPGGSAPTPAPAPAAAPWVPEPEPEPEPEHEPAYWAPEPTPWAPEPESAPAPWAPDYEPAVASKPTEAPEAPWGEERLSRPSSSGSRIPRVEGDFARAGYYNADSQQNEGLVFLSNNGGQGSGVWSPTFGNTLSYVSADGLGGAAEPQTLAATVVPSGKEFAIMSDEPCDESCGYIRPGSVAYKGFDGADKTFLLEFSMPHQWGATDFQKDVPAIWMLNAKIPYTAQYQFNCHPDCGEFDVFEVLDHFGEKAKTTFHARAGQTGGDSNYFRRPVDGTLKLAVIFDSASSTVSVRILDNDIDFPASLSVQEIESLRLDEHGPSDLAYSSFNLW